MNPPDVITVTLNPAIDRTLTIPRFTAGEVNRVEHMRDNPGGKGVNVAAKLAELGHQVVATGFLGKENTEPFETLFRERGIRDAFLHLPGATRVGIKIMDPVRRETTDINFPGLAPAREDVVSMRQRLGEIAAPWCVLAGSLPSGVAQDEYLRLVRGLHQRGGRVMLDTSGTPLREALAAGPDAIKPNADELGAILGRSLTTRRAVVTAARELVQRGIGLVVVSMGAKGAVFVTSDTVVTAKPPRMEVRSTVGAGDAMVAGTVSGLLRGLPLADTARLATACSMEVLSRPEPGVPSSADFPTLLSQVTIT